MAASARTWLLFVRVVVSVPLPILVQASVGWCTPCLGCLHRLVCLYQIKLNNVKQSSNKAQNKAQNQGRGARGSPRAGPPMKKEGGVRSARSGKDLHALDACDTDHTVTPSRVEEAFGGRAGASYVCFNP